MSLDALTEFWSERSARERKVLAVGGALTLLALLYLFLWEPGLAASKKLSATLPKLRAQVEDMRAQQKEIAALRKNVAAASQSGDVKALLHAAVARSSLLNSVQRIDAASMDRATMVAAAANFDDWLGWIGELQRDFGVRLERCSIAALDQPGVVRIEATFVAPGAARKQP
jgi:general secretion pathway protein M